MHIICSISRFFRNLSRAQKILYPCSLAVFLFLMSIALSPLGKLRVLEAAARQDSTVRIENMAIIDSPELSGMVRLKSFKEALLKLSEKDSIQLVVNLSDSTVCLYIRGVKIHQVSIADFKPDPLLAKLTGYDYEKIFSRPLMIKNQSGTIVKEPVVIRLAPKDTMEAALNAWQPDTLIQNPAFLKFQLDYGINLVMTQDTMASFRDRWAGFRFYTTTGLTEIMKDLGRIMIFKSPDYQPTIRIKLSQDDLRAIFRALPHQAYVVLYLPG